MANVSVWPALGTTVAMDDGVTTVTEDGAVLTATTEVLTKIRAGVLVTRDPRASPTDEIDTPTATIEQGAPLTVVDLFTRAGEYSGQPIVVNNYDTGKALGGGLFRWDPASASTHNAGTIVGTSGVGRWLRVYPRDVHAEWFGVVADGVTDDIVPLQRAADYVMANGGKLKLPAGEIYISKTLHLSVSGTYSSIFVEGAGKHYADSALFHGTRIVAGFSNAPAININGARITSVVDLTVSGLAHDHIYDNGLGLIASSGDITATDWEDPALHANAYQRYTPYAGICIDGWSGSAPSPTSYPVTDRAYGQLYSSDVTLDVMVDGFEVAFAIQPCDADGNADFIKMDGSHVKFCKYVLSVGNTQARNNTLDNVVVAQVWRVLTTATHGRQNGKFGGVVKNLSVYASNGIVELGNSSGIYGPLTFLSLYGESIWRIGDATFDPVYATSVETSITFDSCEIGFHTQTEARGIPATILGGGITTANWVFRGGVLRAFPSVVVLNQPNVLVDGTLIRPDDREDSPLGKEYVALLHNATAGGLIFQNLRSTQRNRVSFRQFNLDTLASPVQVIAHDGMTNTARTKGVPVWVQSAGTSSAGTASGYRDSMPVPRAARALAKSSFSVPPTLTQSASERGLLTLVWTSLTDATAAQDGYEPGDVIYDDQTGMVFAIRKRTTTTVLAEAQNNYRLSDGVGSAYETISAFSGSTGNFYFINSRLYTPTYPVIADTVLTGSATYDPGSLADGEGATTTVTVTGAAAGDFVDASFTAGLSGITVTAWVSAADTVSVRFQNESGGVLDLASGTLTARVRPRDGVATILRNVGRDDTSSTFIDTDIAVNDRVFVDQYADRWVSASNSLITARDGTAKTITMAGAMTRSLERKRIPWFIRQPPTNSETRE